MTDEQLPKMLWHYTSIDTAFKILTSRTLRASHCNSMNDLGEWKYGLGVVDDFLYSLPCDFDIGQTKRLIHKLKETGLDKDYFTISFCDQKDALALWRGYCHNGGCAIGFNPQKLIQVVNDINDTPSKDLVEWQFKKCHYYNDEDNREIQEILNRHIQDTMQNSKTEMEIFEANGELSSKIIDFCMLIKHSAYQEEKEWRLIDDPHREQILLDGVRPYVEIRFKPWEFIDLVTEVRLAPNSSQEDRIQIEKAKFHLRNEIIDDESTSNVLPSLFQITQSQLPYRN